MSRERAIGALVRSIAQEGAKEPVQPVVLHSRTLGARVGRLPPLC